MQGLAVDTLVSKRIPAASRMSSLTRRVAEYATKAIPTSQDRHAVMANDPTAKAATSRGAVAPAASSVPIEQTRVYAGLMTMSGTFSDSLGQKGTWSGTLKDTLTVTLDAAGNGTGSGECDGILVAHVTEPDGSVKTTQSQFDFPIADLSLQHGKLTESSAQPFNYEGLVLSVNVSGSLSTRQPTASQNLSIPFDGTYEGVTFNGSIDGTSSLKTAPLIVSGAAARQTAYAAVKMAPFKNLAVTDLNSTTVTATVTLSNPANGTLSDAAGGTYNKATGTYSFSGGAPAVNHALNALAFDPTGNRAGSAPTAFTLKITDAKGASLVNRTTSVIAVNPLSIKGVSAHQSTTVAKAIAPFPSVTIGDLLGGKTDTIKITLSKPGAGTIENLSGGFYNQKTGVYVIETSAAAATSALRALKFDPTGSGTTDFTILVRNAAGATVTNGNTTVVAGSAKPGTTDGTGVALFSQYVAAGLHRMPDHAAGIPTLHDTALSAHFEFAGSHR